MAQGKPSQSKTQMKQTEKPTGNLFPYGAIKNVPQTAQGGKPEVKQAIGAKAQPDMSKAPQGKHPAPGAAKADTPKELASDKKKLAGSSKSIQRLFAQEEKENG